VTAAEVGRPAAELTAGGGTRPPGPGRAGPRRIGPRRIGPWRAGPRRAGPRLVRLYLASRRVLACLLVLTACAVALRTALHWLPRTGVFSREIPLILEAGAAAAIGATTRGPFGEPERATGLRLPALRLGVSLALAGAALGALAAGSASAHLADGSLGLLRDLNGLVGIALLAAVLVGGGLSWIGPIGYLAVALPGVSEHWTTPWAWPARPPHDRGAAICAALVFAAGIAAITLRGARDAPVRD
jgi:hypothetical protein